MTTDPRKTPLRGLDDAVNAVVPFLIAVGLFAGAFAGILAFTNDRVGSEPVTSEPRQRLAAEKLADMLVSSTGYGWEGGPDAVERLGLMRPDGRGIDLERVAAMQDLSLQADPTNGKVDYEEALASLGMPTDGTAGFHVRIREVGVAHGAEALDPASIRTAYVGDFPKLQPVLVALASEEEMAEEAREEYEALVDLIVRKERERLEAVGVDFDNDLHIDVLPDVQVGVLGFGVPITTLVPQAVLDGDVYPDDSKYLKSVLPKRLSGYDLVVVGSGVDHNALGSNEVKDALAAWTLDGGTLIVLGSDQQDDPWLKPLFAQATPTLNQQQVIPDTQNRVLTAPHPLDWTAYDDHDQGWDLDQGGDPDPEHFVRVLINDGRDTLSISGEGVYGEGHLMLTSYRPGDIANKQGDREAEAFFDNLVHYAFGWQIYLDFGPTPPDDASAGSARRISQAWDDRAGLVPLEVQVIVWGRP